MSKEKEIKKTKEKAKDNKKKTDKKKESTAKKEKKNIFKSISKYFKGVFKELKRIRWTSGKELISSSITSVIFIAFFALYFAGIELLVSLLRSLGN